MTEIWMPIPSFLGYEASNLGRVRGVDRSVVANKKTGPTPYFVKGVVLKPAKAKKSRVQHVNIHGKTRYIRDLVCEAWNGPRPSPKHRIIHLDGDRLNTKPSNLEWSLKKEPVKKPDDTDLIREMYDRCEASAEGLASIFGIPVKSILEIVHET